MLWVGCADISGMTCPRARYEAELAGEVTKGKLTLAELDEEEQSLDRLRRCYRTIRVRDLFGGASAPVAERRLKECGRLWKASPSPSTRPGDGHDRPTGPTLSRGNGSRLGRGSPQTVDTF